YISSFEKYLKSNHPIEKLSETITIENSSTDSSEDKISQESNNEDNFANDEMFVMVNLATIHKTKINSTELDKLNRQENCEGHATR
ncbi:18981_t:CDS:2, partial [Gigaspora rosea]